MMIDPETKVGDRFWSKVDRSDPDGCWPWIGYLDRHGYGRAWMDGRHALAHRVALTLAGVPLLPGLTVDHLCRNRACVRPDHMEQVTNRENTRRGVVPSVVASVAGVCVRGLHQLAPGNLRPDRRRPGGGQCLACCDARTRSDEYRRSHAAYERGRRARKRAAALLSVEAP